MEIRGWPQAPAILSPLNIEYERIRVYSRCGSVARFRNRMPILRASSHWSRHYTELFRLVSVVLYRVTVMSYVLTACSRLTWARSWRWQCSGASRSGCCVRLLRNSASIPTRHLSSGSGSIWLLLGPWTKLRQKQISQHSTVTTCASSYLFEPPVIPHFVVCSVFTLYSHNEQWVIP